MRSTCSKSTEYPAWILNNLRWFSRSAWLVCRSVSYYTTFPDWVNKWFQPSWQKWASFKTHKKCGRRDFPSQLSQAQKSPQLCRLWLIELSGNWPADWMIYGSFNCPRTGQLTEWFMANWIVQGLAIGLNDFNLIELSHTNQLTERFMADWLTNSTVWGLANWLNDFSLIELSRDWPTDWMF